MMENVRRHWMFSGLLCATLTGPVGQINGYVCVPPGHPWHGTHYSDKLCPAGCPDEDRYSDDPEDAHCWRHTPEGLIEVHGGLTFSGDGAEMLPSEGGWWFGFDTAHVGDFCPGLRYNSPDAVQRDDDYVEMNCELLALQLAAVTDPNGALPRIMDRES